MPYAEGPVYHDADSHCPGDLAEMMGIAPAGVLKESGL